MKYISLCSGIEAATVAWKPLGWNAVAFSEIEKFPCDLLSHYYPYVPNLGDMTKVDGYQFRHKVDLVVGGTPCQGFSVSGLHKGLQDDRSRLALHFVRLVDEINPKWFVWENVPGAFCTGGRRDFGAFVAALAECGYHLAWRVLDAKFFGVPQRRRRVFVVGHSGDWQHPTKVLFESEGIREYIQESGKTGKTSSKSSQGLSNGSQIDTVYAVKTAHTSSNGWGVSENIGYTLDTVTGQAVCGKKTGVRRLTPLECERIQGFPDNYTNIEGASDMSRYKALGNSMCVIVMRWLGTRIDRVDKGLPVNAPPVA